MRPWKSIASVQYPYIFASKLPAPIDSLSMRLNSDLISFRQAFVYMFTPKNNEIIVEFTVSPVKFDSNWMQDIIVQRNVVFNSNGGLKIRNQIHMNNITEYQLTRTYQTL